MNKSLEDTLFVWNEKLSQKAAIIVNLRLQYVNLLKQFTKCIYSNFTKEKENLSLNYFSNSISRDLIKKSEENDLSIEEISESVLKRLKEAQKEENN